MIWIEARITIRPEGNYVRVWLQFDSSSWESSVSKFQSFANGYYVASGGQKCFLEQLRTGGIADTSNQFKIPEEMDKLIEYLQKFRIKT